MADSRQQTADSPEARKHGSSEAPDPGPRRRICNWCAKVVAETAQSGWTQATLRIDGLNDGSISWLPERTLRFCPAEDCIEQVRRVESFFLEVPSVSLGAASLRVWLTTEDSKRTVFDLSRYWGHEEAAADARAFAHFFTATSHPKLRRVLEAFEPGEAGS